MGSGHLLPWVIVAPRPEESALKTQNVEAHLVTAYTIQFTRYRRLSNRNLPFLYLSTDKKSGIPVAPMKPSVNFPITFQTPPNNTSEVC